MLLPSRPFPSWSLRCDHSLWWKMLSATYSFSAQPPYVATFFFLSWYNIPPFSPYPPIVTGQDTPPDMWETLSEFSKLTRFSAIILLLKRVKGLCSLSISNGSLTSHFMQKMNFNLSLTNGFAFHQNYLQTFKNECPQMFLAETLLFGKLWTLWAYTMRTYVIVFEIFFYYFIDSVHVYAVLFVPVSCALYWFTCYVFMCECTLWLHSNPLH